MLIGSRGLLAASCALVAAAAACSNVASSEATSAGAPDAGTGPVPGRPAGDAGTTPADAGLPAERELEGEYQTPVATSRFVWVANPTSGRVAYIDATTLEVRTVEAGNQPSVLAAIPDAKDDVAIVLNTLSQDATLLRATEGTLSTRRFKIGKSANRWAVSSDGRWAIAWTDWTRVAGSPPATQGFQYVTVLDLTEARPSTVLAVGYRPVSLSFSRDGSRAFAVCDDVISVLDLKGGAAPSRIRDLPLAGKGGAATRDVSITPDGSLALIRQEGQREVTVVSLTDEAQRTISLPGVITDLDLTEEGDAAVAVMREAATVAVLPLPAAATDPSAVQTLALPGETIGSVSIAKGGKSAVLYTNAADAVQSVSLLSMGPPLSARTVRLRAPVHAVFPAPDAKNAIVLHQVAGGAFSLVPLAQPLSATIVDTGVVPHAVALSPEGDRAVISVRDDASRKYAAHVATLASTVGAAYGVETYALASPPIAVGIVARARRAYVAQQHPEGRLTFIELDTGTARTLTGFELGARVVRAAGANGGAP